MPIVDLDDELSVVGEETEQDALESPMDAFSDVDHSLYSGMKSDASAMEEMSTSESQDGGEQQWIIDSIMNHKKDDSPEGMNVSGSETDDSSLYLTEMDNLEESVRNPESKQVTPKTKNQKKAAPSPNNEDYQNYMNVSGIVDDFGETEESGGWRKKVASTLKKKQEPKENSKKTAKTEEEKPAKKVFGRRTTNGSDKSEEAMSTGPKESWRNKNLFRGKNAKKTEEKSSTADAETNLAPLANFDHVDTPKEEEKSESWMPKISFLGKSTTGDAPKDDFEKYYAADVAPLGAVADVEANTVDETADDKKPEAQASWSSKMTSLISTITETKQEPKEMPEESTLDDDKSTTSSVGLTDSINLANDIVSSLGDIKTEEADTPEDLDEEKGEDVESLDDCVTEEDDIDETEGRFVGTTPVEGMNDNGDSGPYEQTEVPEGNDDKKKTWKAKVKSVRKKSSSKLSSIRKSGKSKLSQKSFTQDKMKQIEAAGDDKTVETGGTAKSNDSVDGHRIFGSMSDRRKKIVGIVTLCIILVCVIIGIVIGTRNASSDTPTKIEVPVERVEYLYKLLFPISGNDLEVENPDDPLVEAFIWTAEDSMMRSDSDDEIILRYVAAAVYFSLGGENWLNQNNFLSHDDLCTWNDAGISGIICSDNEITELKLANNNLEGNIPEEIRHLSSLKLIHMGDNAITGMLTEELFELDWLEELHLASNSMTGTVPEAVGEGAVLKILDLTGNGFTGSIPEFSDRTSIQRLYLGLNKLKGTIPDSLALAPDLVSLHLPQMSLTGTIPDLFQSGSLRVIELRGNKLAGNIEDVFKALPMDSTEKIILSNNKFTGTLPLTIGDFYKIADLRLEGNKISGSIPTTMGDLKALTSLRLRLNRLTGSIPSELGDLSLLTDLLLDGNDLEGVIPSELASLPRLESLMLSENKGITGGVEPFCARDNQLGLFGVNTCGSTDLECPCCNGCCTTDPAYGCFVF